ncbi:histidine phosphatase family protein [Aquabacterium sp.]|uniref:histidine phosphatase family protein n=1 Tax=Aquabacterium sp. TaxID=1872578 RepID=UPI003782FE62
MTPLIVIRHGETDWNRQHRFQGQIDVPLNAIGQTQAARLAERLADEPIDVLLASDLQRARSTAEALARRRNQALQVEPLWREQSFGVLEGLDVPTIHREHRPLWDQYVRHEADYSLPGGGESTRRFYERVMQALQAALAVHAGRRIAVVTHGGVLDMLWRAARGLPLHGPRECEIPNTGINRLRWDGDRLQIDSWGEAEHLAGLPEQPSTRAPRG